MKAFLASVTFAAIFAIGASMILNGNFQTPSSSAFATEGARVGNPGSNLVSF
jgi:predicted phage tail protein